MSGYFLAATIIMTFIAIAFLMRPLLAADGRKMVVGLAIVLPAFAAGAYFLIGAPGTDSQHPTSESWRSDNAAANSTVSASTVGSVASMTDGLELRLAEDPNDAKGWLLLSRSYEHLNRVDDAINAYAKAQALGQSDSKLSALLRTQSDSAGSQSSPMQIFGRLSLSDRAADIVLPTDTVFIFARATGDSGVPAAVLQRSASDLPIDFRLDDSQSMVKDVKLSDFNEVVVTARISRSGSATDALKNLEAKTNPVAVAAGEHINLTIE